MPYLCDFFAIIILISINHIISLIPTNLFFGHVCQKFSPRVLLSFCLIFCQFQAGVAYKSVAYKKKRALVICMKLLHGVKRRTEAATRTAL